MTDFEINRVLPVLIIDDEQESLDSLEITLKSHGIPDVLRCQDSRDVLGLLTRQQVEVILMDLSMPHMTGEELLPFITRDYPEIPVIIVTGHGELERAVSCMKAGAFDYMVKPLEPSCMLIGVRRAMEVRSLSRENFILSDRFLSKNLLHPEAFSGIITANVAMNKIFAYVEAIAGTSHCVSVTGETGVGKELIVRAIHQISGRKGELVSVNVAGLDDHMFSDTLFGHERGAFTGADKQRNGLVEKAEGGTLFLDEIGDLAPVSQAKLLRLLQEKEYFRLGSDVARRANVRVVVATHHDITMLQEQGKYRKDLYYRLMTHHINVPSLRDRAETDLGMLVDHFLAKSAKELGKNRPSAPPEIVQLLGTYDFPGNVRELEGLIFDSVSRHKSKMLSLESIRTYISQRRGVAVPAPGTTEAAGSSVSGRKALPTIKQAINLLVADALKDAGGNKNIAAQILGITPQALGQRLRRSGAREST